MDEWCVYRYTPDFFQPGAPHFRLLSLEHHFTSGYRNCHFGGSMGLHAKCWVYSNTQHTNSQEVVRNSHDVPRSRVACRVPSPGCSSLIINPIRSMVAERNCQTIVAYGFAQTCSIPQNGQIAWSRLLKKKRKLDLGYPMFNQPPTYVYIYIYIKHIPWCRSSRFGLSLPGAAP